MRIKRFSGTLRVVSSDEKVAKEITKHGLTDVVYYETVLSDGHEFFVWRSKHSSIPPGIYDVRGRIVGRTFVDGKEAILLHNLRYKEKVQ